jgi:twitching motility protein PilT
MDLNPLLRRAVEFGASDIHLKIGQPPILRRDGSLGPMEGAPGLSEEDLRAVLEQVAAVAPHKLQAFDESGDLDIAYQSDDLPRFRVNAFRQRGATSFAFRVIPKNVPSFEQLSLPPGVQKLADEHRGLVLVTGATGSGKTTTLAAMIDFMQALRRALRQDPDVILIGELRDAETAQTALQAAESGHLVLSTLHTVDAAETIGRMVEFFPGVKQPMIRSIMAGVLKGVVSQRLLPRKSGGRVAAVEVMVTNTRIADLIRENHVEEITEAIEEGSFHQMQSFTTALIEHVLSGEVDREVAANASTNRHDFIVTLEQALKRQAAEERARRAEEGQEEPEAAQPVSRLPEPEPLPQLRVVDGT